MTAGAGLVQRAAALMAQGQRDAATQLLSSHLAQDPGDGKAWFYLGRIYLDEAYRWHRAGHPDSVSAPMLLDFASTSFEPAQQLLADSGGVFRALVAVERATLRIERDGWPAAAAIDLPAEDVPLPPVMAELGRNLLASCPRNGVLVTGGLPETAAAWGLRLQGERRDLILIRADMFDWDSRYRAGMDSILGAADADHLAVALSHAAATRAICLGPSVDTLTVPGVTWTPARLVLTSAAAPVAGPALSVFHFGRTGLAGSVWTASVRDIYDLAARRNPALCRSLFVDSDALTLPAIPACGP
ncbi:MAG: tetratricopeptide repeat protein [Gemmatimonadales bacterium]